MSGQTALLFVRDGREQAGLGGHQRERLLFAVLAGAQEPDRLFVRGIACQVVTAQSFHGEDASLAQSRDRAFERFLRK